MAARHSREIARRIVRRSRAAWPLLAIASHPPSIWAGNAGTASDASARDFDEIRRPPFGKGGESFARFGGLQPLGKDLALGAHLRADHRRIAHQPLGGGKRADWLLREPC